MRDDAAIDPDRGICRDSVELQLDRLAAIRGVEQQRAAIPANPARAIALRDVRAVHVWLRRRPIMRQAHRGPIAIVIQHRRRADRVARHRREIGVVMAGGRRRGNVAFVEPPTEVEQHARRILLRQPGWQLRFGLRHRETVGLSRHGGSCHAGNGAQGTQARAGEQKLATVHGNTPGRESRLANPAKGRTVRRRNHRRRRDSKSG